MQRAARVLVIGDSIDDATSTAEVLRSRGFESALPSEGQSPGAHLEEDDTQRVEVAGRTDRAAAHLLRSHVRRSADDGADASASATAPRTAATIRLVIRYSPLPAKARDCCMRLSISTVS